MKLWGFRGGLEASVCVSVCVCDLVCVFAAGAVGFGIAKAPIYDDFHGHLGRTTYPLNPEP